MTEYLPPSPPSAKELVVGDEELEQLQERYSKIPSDAVIQKAKGSLEDHGFKVTVVATKAEGLELLKSLFPDGSVVYQSSSTGLYDIGWDDYARNQPIKFHLANKDIRAEPDQMKRFGLRQKFIYGTEYVIGSANAVTETGEVVVVDSSGTRVAPIATASKAAVVVISANKIVPTVQEAQHRIDTYFEKLETKRLLRIYPGLPAFRYTYDLVQRGEPFQKGRIHVVIVKAG